MGFVGGHGNHAMETPKMPKKRQPAAAPPEHGLLIPAFAAVRVGFSMSTLKKGRAGLGPAKDLEFIRIGTSVRYHPEDCDTFIAKHRIKGSRNG